MTNITTTLVILGISLSLFLIGLYLGKKALYVSTAGAISMMILGITLFGNPIQYQSGATVISQDATTDVITYTYTTTEPTLNYLIASILTILGFGAILVSMSLISQSKYHLADEEIS